MTTSLRLTGLQHAELKEHLFPGDEKEAVAIVLCGRRDAGERQMLTAYQVHLIPHDQRTRRKEHVHWETRLLDPLLEVVAREHLAVVKIHSHPSGYREFSDYDDKSDRGLFPTFYALADSDLPHASVIMLPDGEMFGRHVLEDGSFLSLERILVAGDDLLIWDAEPDTTPIPEHAVRHTQAFGEGTTRQLRALTIGVVGLSGLGGPLVEQLGRYGPKKLVLADPEAVDDSNRNRIPGTRPSDVGELKTKVQQRVIWEMGLGTEVVPYPVDLSDRELVLALADCDVVFGCMDEAGGRYLLNRLCSAYLVPYIDLGVRLVADDHGGVSHVWHGALSTT